MSDIKKSLLLKMLICCLCLAGVFMSCKPKEQTHKLYLSPDQIVQSLVDVYTANAATNMNDISFQDSTRIVYYSQIAQMSGLKVEDIQADFELLLTMPDTLIVYQNRAIDTLRMLQDKAQTKMPSVNLGIN
jgi:hypothetical protein